MFRAGLEAVNGQQLGFICAKLFRQTGRSLSLCDFVPTPPQALVHRYQREFGAEALRRTLRQAQPVGVRRRGRAQQCRIQFAQFGDGRTGQVGGEFEADLRVRRDAVVA